MPYTTVNTRGAYFVWENQAKHPKTPPLLPVDITNLPKPNKGNYESTKIEPSLSDLIRPLSQCLRHILGEPPNTILSYETILVQSIIELVIKNYQNRLYSTK